MQVHRLWSQAKPVCAKLCIDNELNLKLKYYMIYKYVWQNTDDENVVQQQRLNKELFAHHLSDLHKDLCK